MEDRARRRGGVDVVETVAAAALLAVAAAKTAAAPSGVASGTPAGDRAAPATTKTGVLGSIDLWQQRHTSTSFVVGVVKKFGDDRGGRLAALVAYYGFFSVFPALLALVTVLNFLLVGNADLRDNIANSALAQFPIVGDNIAKSVSSPLGGNTFALVIGLAGAVWAGMGMVQASQDAMNEVWSVDRADYPGFLRKRVRSLVMLLLIVVLLVVSTGLSQVIAVVAPGVIGVVLLFAGTIALNIAVFMVAYRVLTVADVSWRQVLPGSLFAGAGYALIQYLGSVYVQRTVKGASDTYGTFAVVIGLLSWIFLIAQVMMLGAELNTVVDKRLWPRSLFTRPATPGDRQSHEEQVTAQRMDDTMVVDVEFQR